jgi:hypothetical protein
LLQKELPERRRAEFEIALALIWLGNTPDAADADHNGRVDLDDMKILMEDAAHLLTDIGRGELVPAIERRERNQGGYAGADYFKQLDGLGYDEVLSLAGRQNGEPYLALSSRHDSYELCGGRRRTIFINEERVCLLDGSIRNALNAGIRAFNSHEYADARAAIADLKFDRLTPYERGKTEGLLFSISYAEGNYDEAREHLGNAVNAGGLNAEEVLSAVAAIRRIESRLSPFPRPEPEPPP